MTYHYPDNAPAHTHAYLWPIVHAELNHYFRTCARGGSSDDTRSVFDLGCGNGAFAAHLEKAGYQVTGVDPSESGISVARETWPDLNLHVGSGYDDLASRFGTFDALVSLEVIEHVYAPREFMRTAYQLLKPGGIAIFSTPFHGYWKNLALAITGKLDAHFTALWDHGHIKFWSVKTLTMLLTESGFVDLHFRFAGRIPAFAKSMVVVAKKDARSEILDARNNTG